MVKWALTMPGYGLADARRAYESDVVGQAMQAGSRAGHRIDRASMRHAADGMPQRRRAAASRFKIPPLLRAPLRMALGIGVLAVVAFAVGAMATWDVDDPSFSYATARAPSNAFGYPGAAFADIVMQFLGLAAVVALVPMVLWALFLIRGITLSPFPRRFAAWMLGAALAAAVIGCLAVPENWPLPTGLGGVIGDMILRLPAGLTGGEATGVLSTVLAALLAAPAAWLLAYGAGVLQRMTAGADEEDDALGYDDEHDEEEEEDTETGFAAALGAVTHGWFMLRSQLRRATGGHRQTARHRGYAEPIEEPYDFNEDELLRLDGRSVRPARRQEPAFQDSSQRAAPVVELDADLDDDDRRMPQIRQPRFVDDPPFDMADSADFAGDDDEGSDIGADMNWAPVDTPAPSPATARAPQRPQAVTPNATPPAATSRVVEPLAQPRPAARAAAPSRLAEPSGDFELPSLELLTEAKNVVRDASLSADALEQNARMLEGVLEDFGVRGEIIQVRPGPVVTLYELEPAPGIKSSRVIGLADDIARSMSAIAARVAVVPGRNAIGIELPNQKRETVYLRELLASRDFEGSKLKLAMGLGKTIGGEPVVADLAKMPHLLVAGTTGSGKSVAINTMILSLLYRLSPEQCRLIMIDPKMLELSVYDGIPHLLTPVVTDPKKAVVALKWTVREMEERYKKMSKLGVRNIDGFNARVEQAMKKGDAITRTVQTGFDRQTGEAVYETEEFDLEPIPYIVVIIDEMADLMMVAGKDIEGTVQRLAQMARAAGIHVIMATQRPSVDVITGTIKANFPTRISFQVTSKIDSRTILGEQGAEQLLGMGDMLYMAGGGRIQRVHGPFVSDNEVEDVVAYLKTQGVPQYLESITEEDEDGDEGGGGSGGPAGTSNLADSDDPYDQAVAIVLRDGKASTSYIQRRLGIGYNRAASLIERMEQEGVISPANHAGKREILVPTEEDISGPR
jgi:DNA segregation ATPase FtsK/SpoIIIE, S-DNA-T family